MRRLSALLLSTVLFAGVSFATSLATSLAAPETASAQTDAERTRARAAYTEGQRRFDAGDFAGALTKFEEAYSIVSNPVVLLGVASAQERLGRTADARATLERYLRERPDAPDRADVEGRITAMGGSTTAVPATGTLVITSEPAGAAVVVDGESSGAVTPTEVTVAPGDHEVALALTGYELSTETVTVAAGARAEVSTALTVMPEADAMSADEAFADEEEEEAAEEEPAPQSGPSAATWVTTAIAGVALITGTVFGFIALSRQSDFDVTPTTGPGRRRRGLRARRGPLVRCRDRRGHHRHRALRDGSPQRRGEHRGQRRGGERRALPERDVRADRLAHRRRRGRSRHVLSRR